MTIPQRKSRAEAVLASRRIFFATSKTSQGKSILQSERNAMLLVDVLRANVSAGKFDVLDFVIMPDHIHLLLSLPSGLSIERAMQLVKGAFSYRLRKEHGYKGDVWQRGFYEVRVCDTLSLARHHDYIQQNPMRAGLVGLPEHYPHSYMYLARRKAQGLKPS